MDAKTFIVRLIEATAWPTLVGFVFWHIRVQLGALVTSISRPKWKDAEITFGKEIDRLEEQAGTYSVLSIQAQPDARTLAAEAQLPPAYLIQQAWMRTEMALYEAAMRLGNLTTSGRPVVGGKPYRQLNLSSDEVAMIDELRKLRNRAVHLLDPDVTITDALRYKAVADSLERSPIILDRTLRRRTCWRTHLA